MQEMLERLQETESKKEKTEQASDGRSQGPGVLAGRRILQ